MLANKIIRCIFLCSFVTDGSRSSTTNANDLIYRRSSATFVTHDDYDVKMPNFTLYRGSTQATTKFPPSFCSWLWFLGIQL